MPAAIRFWSSASIADMKSSVVRYGWSARIRIARSLVIFPDSTTSTHTCSSVCANCTTNFYRLPNSRFRCDWRVIANGKLDRSLYKSGLLDRSLPFDDQTFDAVVMERCLINIPDAAEQETLIRHCEEA